MAGGEEKRVLVTGGNGFIGTWFVRALLERGYAVSATYQPGSVASAYKWHPVSKTMVEKAAWEYAEKHGLDIVVINPSTCLGPLLQPGLNVSSAVVQQLLQAAQILLLETPSACRRHLCTNGIYQFKDFAETVAKLCPDYNVHSFTEETQPGLVACKDAAKKLINMGMVFTPIQEAIKDAEMSPRAKGFLTYPNL